MSDTKQDATSPEYAKAKRDAHVPTEVGADSPEKPGDEHGSGEYNNRLVNG
jgi:hypothetical protein